MIIIIDGLGVRVSRPSRQLHRFSIAEHDATAHLGLCFYGQYRGPVQFGRPRGWRSQRGHSDHILRSAAQGCHHRRLRVHHGFIFRQHGQPNADSFQQLAHDSISVRFCGSAADVHRLACGRAHESIAAQRCHGFYYCLHDGAFVAWDIQEVQGNACEGE